MKLAIFDFDGTLFPMDTLPYLMRQWSRLHYPKIPFLRTWCSVAALYVRYKTGRSGKLTREQIRNMAMDRFNRIFNGMSQQQIHGFFSVCAERIIPQLNEPVVKELQERKAEGCHIVLLSGCYATLLSMIGSRYGVDHVIGTEMHFKEEIIDLTKPLVVITGQQKMQQIRQHYSDGRVDWESSYAYADSSSDLPVLEAVGYPVAVNPEAKLRAIAEEKNWKIIQ